MSLRQLTDKEDRTGRENKMRWRTDGDGTEGGGEDKERKDR